MAKDPAAVAAKWQRNLAGSLPTIQAGVQAVTTAPNAKAAAAAQTYAQNTAAAVASGAYQRGNQAVSLGAWQNAYLTKGIPRIAGGAQAAQPKVQQYQQFAASTFDAIKQQVANMPKGGVENAVARSREAITRMSALKGKFKSQGG